MGLSASEVANKLWPEKKVKSLKLDPADVEWLHCSAFSFGKPTKLSSPQKAVNMIFGTKETNTVMLRAEGFIKRLARRTGDDVNLKTYRYCGKLTWMNAFTWLTPTLVYQFQSEAVSRRNSKSTSQTQFHCKIYFAPLERKMPVLMETYLDIAVEKLVFNWKDAEDAEDSGMEEEY